MTTVFKNSSTGSQDDQKAMSAVIMPAVKKIKSIFLIVIVLSLIAGWAIPRIKIENDLMSMLPDGTTAKEAYFDAEDTFGSTGGIAISITSGKGIYQEELIQRMARFSAGCKSLNRTIPARIIAQKAGLPWMDALVFTGFLQGISTDPDFTATSLPELFQDSGNLAEAIADFFPGDIDISDPDGFSENLAGQIIHKVENDPGLARDLIEVITQPTDRRKKTHGSWVEDVISITSVDTVWPEFTDKTVLIPVLAAQGVPSGAMLELFFDDLLAAGAFTARTIMDQTGPILQSSKYSPAFRQQVQLAMNDAAAISVEKAMALAPKQIRVADLVPEVIDAGRLDQLKRRLHSWSFFDKGIYSSDEKSLLLVVRTAPNLDQENRDRVLSAVKTELKKQFQNSQYSVRLAGYSVVDQAVSTRLLQDVFRLFPLVCLVVVLFLILSFRNIWAVVYPLLTVFIATAWCIGTMSLLNVPIAPVSIALPVLLVAVGSAYGIHLVHYFYNHHGGTDDPVKGITATLDGTGKGVIMAGLTTVAGFASLAFNDIVPLRDFGIFTALGVFFSLLISIFLISALLARFGLKVPKRTKPEEASSKSFGILDSIGQTAVDHPRTITITAVLILVMASVSASNLRVEMNNIAFFKTGSDIRKADAFINQHFSGTVDIRVVFSSENENGIVKPAVLDAMQQMEAQVLTEFPEVGKAVSILDLIRKMNQAFYFNDPDRYRLPQVKDLAGEQTTQALMAHVMSYIDKYPLSTTRPMIDITKKKAAMTFQVKTASSALTGSIIEYIDALLAGEMGDILTAQDVKVQTTGTAALYLAAEQMIVHGQLLSIAVSLIIVLVLVSLIMQSLVYGLLAVLPLCLALVVNFGIMGLLDIPLDAATAITACVAIGIGIDYGLHYLNRYRLLRAAGADHRTAALKTVQTTGGAIIINAAAVGAGFLVLVLSEFVPLVNLGILIATTMLVSAAGALTILPAALTLAEHFQIIPQKK